MSNIDIKNQIILKEILLQDDVVESIKNNFSYLVKIIPEIKPMISFDQKNPNHHLDVWNHTLCALSYSEKSFDERLVLLLHDIGKPFSYQDDKNGIRHFNNHPNVSAAISEKILKRLNYKEEYINEILYLIKNNDNKITKEEITKNITLEYKRYNIQKCDILAHKKTMLKKRLDYLEKTKKLFNK